MEKHIIEQIIQDFKHKLESLNDTNWIIVCKENWAWNHDVDTDTYIKSIIVSIKPKVKTTEIIKEKW